MGSRGDEILEVLRDIFLFVLFFLFFLNVTLQWLHEIINYKKRCIRDFICSIKRYIRGGERNVYYTRIVNFLTRNVRRYFIRCIQPFDTLDNRYYHYYHSLSFVSKRDSFPLPWNLFFNLYLVFLRYDSIRGNASRPPITFQCHSSRNFRL